MEARDPPAGGSPQGWISGEGGAHNHHTTPLRNTRGGGGGLGWSSETTGSAGIRGGSVGQEAGVEEELLVPEGRGGTGSGGGEDGAAVSPNAGWPGKSARGEVDGQLVSRWGGGIGAQSNIMGGRGSIGAPPPARKRGIPEETELGIVANILNPVPGGMPT